MRGSRESIAEHYIDSFKDTEVDWIDNPRGVSTWHLFNILLSSSRVRDQVIKECQKQHIQTAIHYTPLHWMTLGRRIDNNSFPVTDMYARRVLSIPCHDKLTYIQAQDVVKAVQKAVAY